MVRTDFFHWNGQDFLLIVDYYSKYWETERLHNISSALVIKKMKMMFSRLGIPEVVLEVIMEHSTHQEHSKNLKSHRVFITSTVAQNI